MVDFATTPPPLALTSVLAATDLSDSVTVYTAKVPIGSGAAPFEGKASGVDFYPAIVVNDATGNITATFQCSYDDITWYTISALTYVGVLSGLSSPARFHVEVGSRQWRYVRAGFLAASDQSGTASTVACRAQVMGIRRPFVTTAP